MKPYGWIMNSVVLVSMAQLLMKWGVTQLPPFLASFALFEFATIPTIPLGALFAVGSGIVAYAASMGCWLCALRHLPLSTAYPLLSLSYALVYLAAVGLPCFSESAGGMQLLGVVLIIVGVYCVARVDNKTAVHTDAKTE